MDVLRPNCTFPHLTSCRLHPDLSPQVFLVFPGFEAPGPPPSRSRSGFLPACSRSPRSCLPPGLFCPVRQTARPCPAAGQLTGHCQPHLAEMQKCRKLEIQKYGAAVCWPALWAKSLPTIFQDPWVGKNYMNLQ